MAERVIHTDSDKIDSQEQDAGSKDTERLGASSTTPLSPLPTTADGVIWTPHFIVVFFLTVVLMLSGESLLTGAIMQGWLNPGLVFVPHSLLVLSLLYVLIKRSRSPWLRVGGVFAGIWVMFAGASFFINDLPFVPKSAIPLHLFAVTNAALLGCYVCLSSHRTLVHHWDNWFFRCALIVAGCAVAAVYFLLPNETRSGLSLEGSTATVMLFLSLFVWWLRPSCWRSIPGPTFLFGVTPFILLLLAIPDFASTSDHFFFSQVAFLTLLLGILRTLQGERIVKL